MGGRFRETGPSSIGNTPKIMSSPMMTSAGKSCRTLPADPYAEQARCRRKMRSMATRKPIWPRLYGLFNSGATEAKSAQIEVRPFGKRHGILPRYILRIRLRSALPDRKSDPRDLRQIKMRPTASSGLRWPVAGRRSDEDLPCDLSLWLSKKRAIPSGEWSDGSAQGETGWRIAVTGPRLRGAAGKRLRLQCVMAMRRAQAWKIG